MNRIARSEDAARAGASGYQAHLAEPVSPEDLVAALVDLQRKGPL